MCDSGGGDAEVCERGGREGGGEEDVEAWEDEVEMQSCAEEGESFSAWGLAQYWGRDRRHVRRGGEGVA